MSNPELYPQDPAISRWSQNDAAPLYPQLRASDWEPMPDNYVTPGGEILEFRVTYSNTERAQLLDIRTILDVMDRELSLEDVSISASGDTRIGAAGSLFQGGNQCGFRPAICGRLNGCERPARS